MSWEKAVRRQAVVAWRDEQLLTAYALFSASAREARAAFDQRLAEHASLYDTVWDPAGFAEPRIDAELRRIMPRVLTDYLDRAASDLAAIGPEFAELAEALQRSHVLDLPQAPQIELPASSASSSPATRSTASPATADDRSAIRKRLEKLAEAAGDAVTRGAEMLQKQADTVAEILQEKAGLRERVRVAAQKRIASHWMGETGDPQPVLSQIVRIIENTTETARMTTL